MKSRKFKSVLAVLLFAFIVSVIVNPKAPPTRYYDGAPEVLVIAHQGGDGVWPGDTMLAFENAVQIGSDVLEMDAHITKDGHIVLMHDEKVDRTTDGTGLIEDMTLEQLKRLDAAYDWSADGGATFPYRGQGIKVPTLEEVFQRFPQMRFVIEIKLTNNPIEKRLCDLIRRYNMQEKALIGSFHDEAMTNFRATCPEVATSAASDEVRNYVLLGKVFLWGFYPPRFQTIQPPWNPEDSLGITIVTERFIRESQSKNIRVEPWTVNDPDLMKQYIEWGVDGIITDRPDLLVEVLGK
ncbi:MAG: glycerophosphodiester phosphodiesterase [Chloroflexota bacterium]